jgi:hypothetical protein
MSTTPHAKLTRTALVGSNAELSRVDVAGRLFVEKVVDHRPGRCRCRAPSQNSEVPARGDLEPHFRRIWQQLSDMTATATGTTRGCESASPVALVGSAKSHPALATRMQAWRRSNEICSTAQVLCPAPDMIFPCYSIVSSGCAKVVELQPMSLINVVCGPHRMRAVSRGTRWAHFGHT